MENIKDLEKELLRQAELLADWNRKNINQPGISMEHINANITAMATVYEMLLSLPN